MAEVLFCAGKLEEFRALVIENPLAAAHILAIQHTFRDEGKLAEAQNSARALLARDAARRAAREIMGTNGAS